MMRRLLSAWLATVLLLLACAPAAAQGEERLNAGDVLQVVLPGEDAFTAPVRVDRDGRIELPEVGRIAVAGLTLADAREKLRATLAGSFRDLSRFNLLLKEHRLLLTVLGYVRQPGPIDLPEGAGVQMAINAAGGLSQGAQLDHMQVRRGAQVIVFDYSKYLDSGDGHLLPALRPLDELFVPASKLTGTVQGAFDAQALAGGGGGDAQAAWLRTPPARAVRVIGAVRAPGRYAWSDEMSLLDLIAQAGGPSERGDLAHLRILSGATATGFDLQHFLDHGGRAGSVPQVHAGDTVTVPERPEAPIDNRAQWLHTPAASSIYVMGSVGHPGRYAFADGLSFLDIITAADGPTTSADILDIRVMHRGEVRDRVSRVNLAAYFESGDDTLLPAVRPGDVIFVPDRNRNWLEESPATTVRVLGAIGKPGRYRITDGMTILDLLAEAGGPASNALAAKIVVVNLSCCGDQARVFNLIHFAKTGDFAELPVVRAGDTVYVPSIDQGDWAQFFKGVQDTLSFVTIFALLKALNL